MSIPVIAFFNNKGGVGNTSLVYHLAWMFAQMQVRVLAADLDPQANLTASFLDDEAMLTFWNVEAQNQTIYGCVRPLIERTGDVVVPEVFEIDDNLALLAGDLRLSRFEGLLAEEWPKTLVGEVGALRVTSAFWRAMQAAASAHRAQLILVDMGPNLGAINRAALLSADFVVIPMAPDLYSLQGLRNLGPTLREWRRRWQDYALKEAKDLGFPLPGGEMQPIGFVIIQHTERRDRIVRAYQEWVERIPEVYVREVLGDAEREVIVSEHLLGRVRHYRSLAVMAQDARKPMFHLKPADGAVGSHVQLVKQAEDNFRALAQRIAERVAVAIPT